MAKFICIIIFAYGLVACGGGGGSSGSTTATPATNLTWPPQSGAEFIAYLDGKTFQAVNLADSISFSNGALTYNGPASNYHMATVWSNGSSYQTIHSCNYTANDLQPTGFNSNGFNFKFNLITTNNFTPGGIQKCQKHNCPSCDYYEYAAINFTADSKCIVFEGELFCSTN